MVTMEFNKHRLSYPVLFLLLSLYYALPLLLKYDWWGVRDWDLFTTVAAVPVGSLVDYGQFPFWNPHLGGGNILFHHPEVAVLTPFFLLYLVFGPVVGLKLQVFICYFIGFWGSFRLARQAGLSSLAGVVTAVAYFGSVHFALHFAEGHMPFTHFCFLPWFVYSVLRAQQERHYVLRAGIFLAVMILGNGAAVPLLYTLLFSAVLFLLLGLQRCRFEVLRNFMVSVLWGVGIAAVKFIPMTIYLVRNRWEGSPGESIPISALGTVFFGVEHSLFAEKFAGQIWSWHEYGAYISPVLLAFGLGALVIHFRRYWVWFVTAVFFLLLGLGDFGILSPWSVLSQLPGFSSTRCTGRAFQMVILCVAVLGGLGYDLVRARIDRRGNSLGRYLMHAAVAIIIGTNLILAWPIMTSAARQPSQEVHRSWEFTHVVDEEPQVYKNYLENKGSLVTPWLSAYHPSRGLVDDSNRVLPEYVLRGQATVLSRRYTPNRIEYDISATRAGEMVIGMGYDPGWRTDDAKLLSERNGLIAFAFRQGEQHIKLTYRTPWFYWGLAVSVLTLAGMAVVSRRRQELDIRAKTCG